MSDPRQFRKKPVVIEAMRLERPYEPVIEWCGGGTIRVHDGRRLVSLLIPTLEGAMRADLGDWIIRGVQGEFYPCKPDIFEATYEAVEEQS